MRERPARGIPRARGQNVIRNVSKLLPRPKLRTISTPWQASSGSYPSAVPRRWRRLTDGRWAPDHPQESAQDEAGGKTGRSATSLPLAPRCSPCKHWVSLIFGFPGNSSGGVSFEGLFFFLPFLRGSANAGPPGPKRGLLPAGGYGGLNTRGVAEGR